MFSVKSSSDVLTVAKTFGSEALSYAIQNSTLSQEANLVIINCTKWAKSGVIEIETFNDGNAEFSVEACFKRESFGGMYVTNLNDIEIVRYGFGSYHVGIREALDKGYISKDNLKDILSQIYERNEAAAILGL